MRTLILAAFLVPSLAIAQMTPERKFEGQRLWKSSMMTSQDGHFTFKVWNTNRGTLRVHPQLWNYEFPGQLRVIPKVKNAPDFKTACRDVLNDDRLENFGDMILSFRANPFASTVRYSGEMGTIGLSELENPQVVRNIKPKLEWDQYGNVADVARMHLREHVTNYRTNLNAAFGKMFHQQRQQYELTGELVFNLGTDPDLRIFACDLALGYATFSLSFDLYGERGKGEEKDWIGNVNLKEIYEGLLKAGKRPESMDLFEAGIALGQEIQGKTEKGLEIFENGRSGKLLNALFMKSKGKFKLRNLNEDELYSAYAKLPEVLPNSDVPKISEDEIILSNLDVSMETR